jgi:hypothetical protein
MQEACSSREIQVQSGCIDKPSLGINADGVHNDNLHSATIVLTKLGADVVQTDNLLCELDVVS